MTGDDLIALASHLIVNTAFGKAEARYRSAISRAYYGAFHVVVAFLDEVGSVRVVENHTGHEQARQLLQASRVPSIVRVADLLTDLRSARNQADYKLSRRGFESQSRAQKWVEAAALISSTLAACRGEPTRSEVALAIQRASDELH